MLAQRADEAKQKVETLQKAVNEFTPDDAKWEEWQTIQGKLNKELTTTEKALVNLQKERDKLADLGFNDDNSDDFRRMSEEIQRLTEKSEGLRIEAELTYEQLGKPIPSDTGKEYAQGLAIATAEEKNANEELKNFNITAEKTKAQMAAISDGAKKVADNTKALSTAGAAVAGALGAMAVAAGKTADDLNTLSKQSGFSTDLIQQWQYAADLIDVDSETIIAAARKMKANMTSTSADVVAAWEKLGVTVYDNNGKLKDAETMFMSTVGALSLVRDETERDILAMTIFGRGADELAGIIDDGGRDLRYYGQQARDLGLILSQDALDGANKFNDGLTTIKAQAQAAFTEAGASLAENLLPELEKLVGWVEKVVTWFANLDAGTFKVIGTVALLVAAISPIAKLVTNVSGAIKGVSDVGKALSGAFSATGFFGFLKFIGIALAVAAAITAIVAGIAVVMGKGPELERTFSSLLGGISKTANVGGDYGSTGASYATQYGGATAGNYNTLTTPTYGTATMTSSGINRGTGAGRGYDTGPITRGGAQDIVINITDTIDGQTLARNTYRYNQDEAARRGTAAVR